MTKVKRGSRMVLLALLVYCAADPCSRAQTDSSVSKDAAGAVPRFEVVSIKPDKGDHGGGGTQSLPDGFRWANFLIVNLIRGAYGVSMDNQIVGLPGWADSEPFDIEARVDEKTAESWKSLSHKERRKQEQPMLRSLLADRFQFRAHVVTRELPVYELVIAKGGLKMKEASPDEASSESMSGSRGVSVIAHAMATSSVVGAVQGLVGRIVVDKTGLADKKFDFELSWVSDLRADATGESGPSIYTALEEQLGLKLVPATGPADVVYIDHIERPSPN